MLDITLGVLVLGWIGSCICCFRAPQGVFRRAGISAMGVLVGTVAIWQGGNNVLEKFDLTWRSWVNTCFLVVMILACLAIPICAAGCMYKRKQWLFQMMCLLCVAELLIGGWWGIFFAALSYQPERDIVWEGRALVEEDQGFLGTRFEYYPRVGPLLKGRETVYVTYEMDKQLCPDQ